MRRLNSVRIIERQQGAALITALFAYSSGVAVGQLIVPQRRDAAAYRRRWSDLVRRLRSAD